MTTSEIVSKLWNLCNVLRDDGITYHQYVTELTYILFLKMMQETGQDDKLPEGYRWEDLKKQTGIELKKHYRNLLENLGSLGIKKEFDPNMNGTKKEKEAEKKEIEVYNALCENNKDTYALVRLIYSGASSNIDEPANLKKIITNIDALDWYSAKEEGLGNLYEGLLEKNANEKKSGAGQYFTPRVLIDVMTELIDPQVGEKCNDPACGTFGFMIAADNHVRKNNDIFSLSVEQQEKQRKKMFTGTELVRDTHRLAMMNALLHGVEGKITLGDTLSSLGESMTGYDVVLTNPPFGTKQGGERTNRRDLVYKTSNKQLNFLQHIYRSLKPSSSARAAVVLPDNVLFADGDGVSIRRDLMNKCNLHTILRLPTGIFYAQGVKTNVLFFNHGESDENSTKAVYFYDLRTNMPTFGKTNQLKHEHFDGFIKAYTAQDRDAVKDERWSKFTREEISQKNDSLDLGLIKDDSVIEYEDLQSLAENGEEIAAKLEEAADLIMSVVKELNHLSKGE